MFLYAVFLPVLFFRVSSERGGIPSSNGIGVVSRQEWKARDPLRVVPINLPLNHVIILHTVTDFCRTEHQCVRNVQFIQDFHLDDRGWFDVAYNFMVGGDSRIYEGRGWNAIGAHSVNFNTNSLGIAFIGNFNEDIPTERMTNATLCFIEAGVRQGYLTPTYEIHGHRDVACTESPGKFLYAEIRKWSNYKGGRLENYNCHPQKPPVINSEIIGTNKSGMN